MTLSDNQESEMKTNELLPMRADERLSASIGEAEMLEIAMHMAGAGYWSLNLETNTLRISYSVRARLNQQELAKIDEVGFWSIIHKDDIEVSYYGDHLIIVARSNSPTNDVQFIIVDPQQGANVPLIATVNSQSIFNGNGGYFSCSLPPLLSHLI